LGRDALLRQKEEGIRRKISGFEILERGIARSGYPVFAGGKKVSQVTSGTFSPFLKKSIGLAYLPLDYSDPDTQIEVEIRGQRTRAKIVPIPFYKRPE
jgi:aminomethyltransferase